MNYENGLFKKIESYQSIISNIQIDIITVKANTLSTLALNSILILELMPKQDSLKYN